MPRTTVGRTSHSMMSEALSHGRIGMALLAGSLTAAAQAALHLPFSWPPLLIAALGTFVIYNLNHCWDKGEDALNAPERSAWLLRSAPTWRVLMALATIGVFLLAWRSGPAVRLVTGALVIIGLGYNLSWPTRHGPTWRLKGRVGLNLALIATGWTLMGIGLPLAAAGTSPALQAVLMALWVGGISGILASAFDLRDRVGDAAHGLSTLAVLLGPERARRFLMGWCLLSVATALGAVLWGAFPPIVLVSTLAPGVAFAWLVRWPSHGDSSIRDHADRLLLAEIAVCWIATLALRTLG